MPETSTSLDERLRRAKENVVATTHAASVAKETLIHLMRETQKKYWKLRLDAGSAFAEKSYEAAHAAIVAQKMGEKDWAAAEDAARQAAWDFAEAKEEAWLAMEKETLQIVWDTWETNHETATAQNHDDSAYWRDAEIENRKTDEQNDR